MAKAVPDAKLFIFGVISTFDSEYTILDSKIRKFGLSHLISLENWIEGQHKNELIFNAKCLVLPSVSESFGNVVLESILLGTKVIASTGTPWIMLNGRLGCHLSRDVHVWVSQLINLMKSEKVSPSDEEIDSFVMQFNSNSVIKLWCDAIRSVGRN